MGNLFSDSTGEDCYDMKLGEDNLLGEGSYAHVYRIKRKKDTLDCAAKIFKIPISQMDSKEETGYERELQILKQANHPFVIRYLEEFAYQKKKLCIVTKFATGGDFEKYMKKKK